MRLVPVFLLYVGSIVAADEAVVDSRHFQIPNGFEIRRVVNKLLVQRPISAVYDELGRLYVTDCNGSNENLEEQLKNPSHRILRLEDTNGDGQFDVSTVFADRMMFPEGAMWHDGSLYVAAPPSISKLADTNDDGIADKREIWFDGKSVTHCGNDLHGPFFGPDGWIYWSKGAWAEQTYLRPGGKQPLVTRAAHIFRRRPDSPFAEPVMTGGMDNPVEIVFMPNGERIFCTTFLQHPGGGLRDGLIHAIYGGVYGKDHTAAFQGHARTGDLMPVLVHMGAAAPSSVMRIESDQLGAENTEAVITSLFNMHKLTRTVLRPNGATFDPTTNDFLTCDDVDFHPTDVLEDADGSLLIVDTGGWYKLCCPTSQLAKPDVLGTIYRLSKKGSHGLADARGLKIDWAKLKPESLVGLLADSRLAVRQRSMTEIARRGPSVAPFLPVTSSSNPRIRRDVLWALSRIDASIAREATRPALRDRDETVRQVALHCVSAWRDELAADAVKTLLKDPSMQIRRAAAEALGRIGLGEDVGALLAACALPTDRVLEHSLAYAMIEIGDETQLKDGIGHSHPVAQKAALIALDQLGHDKLPAAVAISKLGSNHPSVREAAWWIIQRHPDWAEPMAAFFGDQLRNPAAFGEMHGLLPARLSHFLHDESIQNLVAGVLRDDSLPSELRVGLLDVIGQVPFEKATPALRSAIVAQLSSPSPGTSAAIQALDQLAGDNLTDDEINSLRAIAARVDTDDDLRLRVLGVITKRTQRIDDATVRFLCERTNIDTPADLRGRAVEILTSVRLENGQRRFVADSLSRVGPIDLKKLVETFDSATDSPTRAAVVAGLDQSVALAALTPADLRAIADRFGDDHRESIQSLIERVDRINAEKLQRFSAILGLMDKADARRGQLVFQGTKGSCSACHKTGYLGGEIGPDLSRIGDSRTDADLLESILLPNATMVRSFESVTIVTDDGKSFNGLLRAESDIEITLALDATKTVHIRKDAIEQRAQSTVSIMPSGIDQSLTSQELADLVRFLKTAK